ncbi:hypothetical protein BJV78DRAFT_729027 [Lactifluus subvellereus]|nr:hypothetical protein BJV78DRAFT_729027 [Lactifluus subvellereus]
MLYIATEPDFKSKVSVTSSHAGACYPDAFCPAHTLRVSFPYRTQLCCRCLADVLGRLFVHGGVYVRPMRTHNSPQPTNLFLTMAELPNTAIPIPPGQRDSNPAISNFPPIFKDALDKYKRLTKKDLQSHLLAVEFDRCDSPHAVLEIFRKQAQAFEEFRKGDDKLMKWLDPTVNVLSTLSATLGEGLALVVRFAGFTPSV